MTLLEKLQIACKDRSQWIRIEGRDIRRTLIQRVLKRLREISATARFEERSGDRKAIVFDWVNSSGRDGRLVIWSSTIAPRGETVTEVYV